MQSFIGIGFILCALMIFATFLYITWRRNTLKRIYKDLQTIPNTYRLMLSATDRGPAINKIVLTLQNFDVQYLDKELYSVKVNDEKDSCFLNVIDVYLSDEDGNKVLQNDEVNEVFSLTLETAIQSDFSYPFIYNEKEKTNIWK